MQKNKNEKNKFENEKKIKLFNPKKIKQKNL